MSGQVIEAEKSTANSANRRFFVRSTDPSIWYRVDFEPSEALSLACSCPHGRRITAAFGTDAASNPRACRHMCAVADRLTSELVPA